MRARSLVLLGVLVAWTGSAAAACDGAQSAYVPVTFSFSAAEYKTAWAYQSLQPRMRGGSDKPWRTPVRRTFQNGELQFELRLPVTEVPGGSGRLELDLGPRQLPIAARPLSWTGTGTKRRCEMTPVLLLNQPSPDWLIVRDARWLAVTGDPQLEVVIFNAGSTTHPGTKLSLATTDSDGQCFSGPIAMVKLPVLLRIAAGAVDATAPSVGFGDPLKRKASFDSNVCGGTNFLLELGETGPVAGGGTLDLRFQLTLDNAAASDGKHNLGDALRWPHRLLLVEGERAFPARVPVSQ